MITLNVENITISIVKNSKKNTCKRDMELLVEYTTAVIDIHHNTNLNTKDPNR